MADLSELHPDIGAFEYQSPLPVIISGPASAAIDYNTTKTLSVDATRTGLGYQWYQGASGNTSMPALGANSSSFTTPALTETTSYWVRVTDVNGSVDCLGATVTVAAPTAYQAWLNANALPTDGTGGGALTANPSGDGVVNAIKFALGLDVGERGYAGHMNTEVLNVSGADHLALTYKRPEPAPVGVVYTVNVSADFPDYFLSTWSVISGGQKRRAATAQLPVPGEV